VKQGLPFTSVWDKERAPKDAIAFQRAGHEPIERETLNVKRSFLRRGVLLLSVLGVGASTVLTAAPAHATLPAGQVAVAAAGSDTTEKLMTDVMADLDSRSLSINGTAQTVRTYNIPAFTNGYAVQGDADCTDVTWNKDPLAPGANTAATKGVEPFGSGAGRNYLAAENGGTGPGSPAGTDFGCVDVARSSGAPRAAGAGDKSTFEYYAFAFDAVSWATTSLKAPGTLTRQDITNIYDCVVTDWGQLPGGLTGPIRRYFPQAGSGTRSFFISDVLVGKSGSYAPPAAGVGGCTTNAVLIEENEGKQVAPADLDQAILPYSAAVWSFHAQNSINPTLDLRNGARLGGITTTAAIKASPVRWNGIDRAYQLDDTATGQIKETNVKQANPAFSEAGGNFPGVRFVYNVLDSVGNRKGYQAAFQTVGFQNTPGGTKAPLCDATPSGAGASEFALILSNGFAALPATANTTSNLAGATCRFYAGVN